MVRLRGRQAQELDNLHNCDNSAVRMIERITKKRHSTPMSKLTNRAERGCVERSNRRWTGQELRAAVDADKAFWASPAGIEARKRQGTPKPIKRGIHPTVLAARLRQLKA